ncbi:MAG: ATP-binding cassette domain-containing protein [Clostridiales Family XIII bacterium]|jgi:ABC-2 type transport system ATP-binding protein|nr:ATP-binding cassette domain-containing protein [Clostridiales Family XIII bacterium]
MLIISLKDVSKTYKVRAKDADTKKGSKLIEAVKNLSFDIEPGEFIGFIGENGAGKSTTIKMMSGILYPTAGEVTCCGLVPYRKRKENAMNIGVVFGQRSRLVWELPMSDTFALYKEIYRIPTERYERNVKAFVDLLEMEEFFATPVRQLSLGQRMRAEIALSMLHDPKVLFLDEPTIGLDVVAKKNIRDFFKERSENDGTTIILTSHDMKDLDTTAKRLILITKGELLFDGSADALKAKYSNESVAEFTFADGREKLDVAFDPATRKLADVIAEAGAQGEIANVEVKSPDIEDIVRNIYNRD